MDLLALVRSTFS